MNGAHARVSDCMLGFSPLFYERGEVIGEKREYNKGVLLKLMKDLMNTSTSIFEIT